MYVMNVSVLFFSINICVLHIVNYKELCELLIVPITDINADLMISLWQASKAQDTHLTVWTTKLYFHFLNRMMK